MALRLRLPRIRLVQRRRLRREHRARGIHPSSHLPHISSNRAHQYLTQSGRKIIEILEKNPKKDPEKYDDEDLAHMRKVVAYCKRHLAQEEKAKQDTNSKSYKSLKNWGHDPLKS